MSSRNRFVKKKVLLAAAYAGGGLWLCGSGVPAYAEYDDMKVLEMFYEDKELVVTPTRDPKPISQVAENVTVITAKEIQALNAHTLAEVLNTIPGINLEPRTTPGGLSFIMIQGSDSRHVRVLIDGVSVNTQSDALADVGNMPVQRIAVIEVVKGPASSSWGSSLGGIINVITKSPNESHAFGGLFSTSIGERTTGDFRQELSGTVGKLGYYLSLDGITSDGFRSNTAVDKASGYGKLTLELTEQTRLLYTIGYTKADRGFGEVMQPGAEIETFGDNEHLFSTLSVAHSLTDSMDLDLSGRFSHQRTRVDVKERVTKQELSDASYEEPVLGASATLAWRVGLHNITLGADYDSGTSKVDEQILDTNAGVLVNDKSESRLEKRALFANDTIVWNELSFTPGLRYDWTSTNGDFVSPSIGVTFDWADHTILRTYVARGFSVPPLSATSGAGPFLKPNPGLKVERVWSYQAGLESTYLKHVWLKCTLFRHDISEYLARDNDMVINEGKQRRQGFELEARTIPFFNTYLSAGYTFIDARDRETDKRLSDVPRHTYDVGLHYDDRAWLRGAFTGRYVWWNAAEFRNGSYSAMIWDLSLASKFASTANGDWEIFFLAHNLFNGSQYQDELFKNPRRWFEGGVRVRF